MRKKACYVILDGTAVPVITVQPTSQSAGVGQSVTFTVGAAGGSPFSYQWLRNGVELAGATGPNHTIASLQVADAGVFSVTVRNTVGAATSNSVVLGVKTADLFVGAAFSAPEWRTIQHPNGNRYTQVLLTGRAATVTADPGKVTRVSFVDLLDDIVQLEFSGEGTITVTLDEASGPALPVNYNQNVQYMKGHPSVLIQGAGPTTFVSAFAVGTLTAVNQALFRSGVDYNGHAILARLVIESPSGKFGGILMGNVVFSDVVGVTGIFAPGVSVTGNIRLHELWAIDDAVPVLLFGSTPNLEDGVRVTGGSLLQPNTRAIRLSGVNRVLMSAGVDAQNRAEPAQSNQARFERNGVDVTSLVVVPGP